jgi:hypothetical protein
VVSTVVQELTLAASLDRMQVPFFLFRGKLLVSLLPTERPATSDRRIL